ncbi:MULTISPECIES: NAD(P)-dependent oxidoreductase [unclassified Pseudomonas]|uniref:NAD(P)-dependent oxidoreductase n=1 Tax=unclassified Pseudomonas TaxID=196821 RepID=UPI000BD67414|nr:MULTISPECIES: NAD(P)-binding domain-containing protein [unclassified Pseudomonas]PVZ10553.1 3-hydroxyisobutyrate dehydrogenase-like beta-hydroxyacid dehydrogenase [Pseudomonas sp. URIL14HWK12:I12]PVZ21979.1 3-hydroxyisobutyrate dehydrogenase-like beta-hydroxyacid dehydrogenase [Pseudomonas sp. URIL14HWK12:I10]PVZ30938.1 3-hydroxyisobutyrate dehydrogenase-like beta-hydroxyacid dehydrogenase [Pseudomonas sp. URIL14HWK12:I11]SNZ17347.1 3-hydroxyisobutyrate dehydrogenase [Pseudomonas sp. URIL14H
MKIAIIGAGEVGLTYARPWARAGHEIILCDLKPSAAATTFAAELGVLIHSSPAQGVAGCDVVVSCVFGTVSLEVARQALDAMPPGTLFVDMTTADPEQIRTAAAYAAQRNVSYVDVAILGAIALTQEKTNLLGAGDAIEQAVGVFASAGATLKPVAGGAAGDAAALKILRSVFTKGLEALTIECFMAAEKQGVTGQLHDALSDIDQASLRDFLSTLVRTHVIHAPRRLKEVEEAERQLSAAGLPVAVMPGVKALFQRTTEQISGHTPPPANPSLEQAFQWLFDVNGVPR